MFRPNVTMNKSWGYMTANGTFDGIVGNLDQHLIDYGSSPLFVRTDRAEVMEYGRRTWILRYVCRLDTSFIYQFSSFECCSYIQNNFSPCFLVD